MRSNSPWVAQAGAGYKANIGPCRQDFPHHIACTLRSFRTVSFHSALGPLPGHLVQSGGSRFFRPESPEQEASQQNRDDSAEHHSWTDGIHRIPQGKNSETRSQKRDARRGSNRPHHRQRTHEGGHFVRSRHVLSMRLPTRERSKTPDPSGCGNDNQANADARHFSHHAQTHRNQRHDEHECADCESSRARGRRIGSRGRRDGHGRSLRWHRAPAQPAQACRCQEFRSTM